MTEKNTLLLKERLSRFSGKVGTIYVGGENQLELNETRDRIIDAMNATKIAVKSVHYQNIIMIGHFTRRR